MKRIISSLFSILFITPFIYSQNNKSCVIPALISNGEYRLLKSCSPYTAPKSIVVDATATLTSEPGVEIIMPDSAMITVNGGISLVGTDAEPIHFKKLSSAKRWLYIYVYKNKDSARFENVIFDDALRAVYSFNSKLIMRKTKANNVVNFVKVKYGSAKILNSTVNCLDDIGTEISDIVQGVQALMIVDGNFIKCSSKGRKIDGIDIGDFSNCIIRNNTVIGCKLIKNSDCLDCDNCPNVLIKNNIIYNTYDKGISLGSTALGAKGSGIVEGNIVYNCSIGIAVKDTAKFLINHNTFFNNDTSIYVRTAGQATINNTIISSSRKTNLYNSGSIVNITYSLCDNQLFTGTGNIKDNPLFVNSSQYDFNLGYNSPCIDKGDPASPLDPDGSRTDIGALFYNHITVKNIFINEFLAINKTINKDENNEYDSWFELYNNNPFEVDIAGLYLSNDPVLPLKYKIPSNSALTKIPAYGFKIIWCDNQSSQVPLHTNFTLGNSKIQLALYQVSGSETLLMDSISSGKQFSDESYCRYPDGNSFRDYTLMPTPGAANILIVDKINTYNSAGLATIYPNPAKEDFSVILNLSKSFNTKITLFDITGNSIISKDFGLLNTGNQKLNISEINDGHINLQGIYFVNIQIGKNIINKKLTIIK